MPDNPQPRPGPSPTPSPEPVGSIKIGSIDAVVEGAIISPDSQWIPSFTVDQDYLDICNPQPGGYFVQFPDVVCFMSATSYEERYG